MIKKDLEQQGKQQIEAALKNVGLSDMGIDKCDDCELRRLVINIKTQEVNSYCPNCPKDLKEYLDDEQEARELPDDPMDLAKNNFLDKHQGGY